MNSKVFVISGPTCAGKTSLGIKLCTRVGGSIVSADSRQVVRYMDVGTGKLPLNNQMANLLRESDRWVVNNVDIFGYDLINPDEYFSAYDFAMYWQNIFPRISHQEDNIFLVGGTGFYIDVVTGRIKVDPASPNLELRRELEKLTIPELAARLKKLAPDVCSSVDINNPARMVRALEKETHKELNDSPELPNITPIYIGLRAPREVLYSRADLWIDEVFTEPLFEEVRYIKEKFPLSTRLNGFVYKSVMAYLGSELTSEEAKQRAKFDMHAYIRRQQTWFKRNEKIRWFDITGKNFDVDVLSYVESKLNG